MFDDIAGLVPFRETAHLLAERAWGRLYDPDVLVLDEPAAGMNASETQALRALLQTIRRDLSDLQGERMVRRVHGGAVPWRTGMTVPELHVREGQNVEAKRRIGAAAAREVPERGSVLIDSGSTAAHLADAFDRDRDVTVITNAIPIAQSLATSDKPRVVVLGGTLRRRTMAMVDETGVQALRELAVDVLFCGCDGMSPERGFSTPFAAEVAIKQAMITITGTTEREERRDFLPAQRTVMKLHREGMLGEGALLNFARAFKYEEAVAALSAMTGVKIETLDRLISGDRYDPLLIAGKAIDVDWATVRALILLRLGPNRTASPADIETARVNYARLMPATAQRVVAFWKTR